MKLQHIQVKNYRNLDGLEISLNPDMNFLVGENDLGKSNFLDLLDILFNRRSFSRIDFCIDTAPIEIQISMQLDDDELGVFEDYFDPLDKNLVHFVVRQETPEETVSFFRADRSGPNSREINFSPLRRANYIKYDSLKTPKDELGFDRDRGAGRFLNYLVRNTLETNQSNTDILNNAALDPITKRINSLLNKIRPLQRMGVGTFSNQGNQAELITRVLLLKGASEFDIQKSGAGVQFSTLLILSLLERLITMRTSRRWKDNILIAPLPSISRSVLDAFLVQQNLDLSAVQTKVTVTDGVVTLDRSMLDETSDIDKALKRLFEKRSVSIVVGLDEPEIHLHPYMQRSLMNYIKRILTNKDTDFNILMRELLDLDEVDGQALVVSHSPNIMLDDYKQIVRFYREGGRVKAVCGFQLIFDPKSEKHLLMNFPEVKEAFYSRCVVIVEGETEQGAMMVWKDRVLEDADELGISIIRAEGNVNIQPIVRLLNELKINNVSIMDRDNNNLALFSGIPDLYFTSLRDFEDDFYDSLSSENDGVPLLYKAVEEYDERGLDMAVQKSKLKDVVEKYNMVTTWDMTRNQYRFSEPEPKSIPELQRAMFIAWMGVKKSVPFGRYLANSIGKIPDAYVTLLKNAKSKVEGIV